MCNFAEAEVRWFLLDVSFKAVLFLSLIMWWAIHLYYMRSLFKTKGNLAVMLPVFIYAFTEAFSFADMRLAYWGRVISIVFLFIGILLQWKAFYYNESIYKIAKIQKNKFFVAESNDTFQYNYQ